MHETRMDASKKGDQFFKHTVQHNLKFGQICNAVWVQCTGVLLTDALSWTDLDTIELKYFSEFEKIRVKVIQICV